MSYVVNVNDPTAPTNSQGARQGAEELRAIKLKLQQIVAGAIITTAAGANPADVQIFFQPDINDRPAMTAAGWLPWNLNQQWGGAPMPFHLVDAATSVEYKFDAFDAYIDDDSGYAVGDAAARFYQYQVLTPAKNQSIQAYWAKVYKILNPVDNLTLKIWSVAAGVPNVVVATANVINGKQITSDVSGQWYRFSFAAPFALVGGTQYIVTLEKSGGVDAANYYIWRGKAASTKYPNNLAGVGTVAPVWTAGNTISRNFMCEAQTSDQVMQSGGTFTGRIIGSEGNPINRSVGYCKPLKEFMPLFNPNGWSILIRGKSWTKDKTIFEAIYAMHHDRINIRSQAGTGFPLLTVYESDNTVTTLTGTSDISAITYKDILIVGRSLNDGGDYLKIYTGINNVWAKEAESTGLSLIFDSLMLKQGTGWLMGGFPLFNNTNYTKLSEMGVIPSADGWTFTTTSATVEANVFAVSGNKLNQIKAGMAAGGDGFYLKNALAFSNANGWLCNHKLRIVSSSNTKDINNCSLTIEDGTKQSALRHQEYYTEDALLATVPYPQLDLKSADSTVFSTGKGSDVFHFINGKLSIDGTGLLTTASANNQVRFGDISVTANENADVIWDYVGYYNTANVYPQFTSGELHEFGIFSGDKNLLGQALYNAGIPISTKTYCGIDRNFAGPNIVQKIQARGITSGPTTASANYIIANEMEAFVLGSEINAQFNSTVANDTDQQSTVLNIAVDNYPITADGAERTGNVSGVNGTLTTSAFPINTKFNYGLHKITGTWRAGAGNALLSATKRIFKTEVSA